MSTVSWTKCWKKIRGVKIHVAVDKCGIPPAIDVSSATRDDTKSIVPVLRTLAEGGFKVRRRAKQVLASATDTPAHGEWFRTRHVAAWRLRNADIPVSRARLAGSPNGRNHRVTPLPRVPRAARSIGSRSVLRSRALNLLSCCADR
jgi:hypothetical protein